MPRKERQEEQRQAMFDFIEWMESQKRKLASILQTLYSSSSGSPAILR